ncbi:MAG: DMT family transporter, partial [Candidatus Peribacteraceae bacterium]|nr:DMT family transporter [Candidatus Peribacteraceae bacterium]
GFSMGFYMQNGDILVTISAIAYAMSGILVKKNLNTIQPELFIATRAIMAIATFIVLLPFIKFNTGDSLEINRTIIIALLAYGFIAKFLGIYGFYQAIEKLKISTVSSVGTLSIVGGIIFAAIYLGEHVYYYQMIGGGIIILGVLLTQKAGVHTSDKLQEIHMKQHHRNQM